MELFHTRTLLGAVDSAAVVISYQGATANPFGTTNVLVGVNAGDGAAGTRITGIVGNGMSPVSLRFKSPDIDVAVTAISPSGTFPPATYQVNATVSNSGIFDAPGSAAASSA